MKKYILAICFSALIILTAIGVGSVYINVPEVVKILTGVSTDENAAAIILKLRLPRVLLAFFVGAALGVSGTVMQSVLKNPLASSYTLGVSSGAALGAGIVMSLNISLPLIGAFTLPLVGLAFGLVTVYCAVVFASRLDRGFQNHTIILVGMVFSLFVNALLTLLTALSRETMQRLVLWQMGSFALKDSSYPIILMPVVTVGLIFVLKFNRELDIMTFGEEQALSIGVELKKTKWLLLSASAALTGCAVAFAGVIGFIDLVAPHVVRRIFGSSHRHVVPMSALFGGSFMVVADLIARTIVSPSELPVGAVTAIIGAPFFGYVYFSRRRKA